jgi:hypothetical protein
MGCSGAGELRLLKGKSNFELEFGLVDFDSHIINAHFELEGSSSGGNHAFKLVFFD